MKNYFGILTIIIIIINVSCVPSGTEEDRLRREKEKMNLSKPSSGTERYYIDKAYTIGALDTDSIGDYPNAILYLDSALTLNPSNMEAYRLKAYASSLLGENELAISIIEKAIKINPSEPESYMTRAYLLIILERKDEALNSYYKVIELNPNNGRAHEAIGYMEIDKGNKTIGCQFLSKARELGHLIENRESDKYLCK